MCGDAHASILFFASWSTWGVCISVSGSSGSTNLGNHLGCVFHEKNSQGGFILSAIVIYCYSFLIGLSGKHTVRIIF
jgi:hypothetical protein